jgi:hypothetical protein
MFKMLAFCAWLLLLGARLLVLVAADAALACAH